MIFSHSVCVRVRLACAANVCGQLLVMVLSFLTINVDPSGSDRLSNTITLFLTMVAFKLVVKQSLPLSLIHI